MSLASKLTLAGTSIFALGTIVFVHYAQKAEKDVMSPLFLIVDVDLNQAMHQGVIRDLESQRLKKERQLEFDHQRILETEYKKLQNVNDHDRSNEVLSVPDTNPKPSST
ncbi:putative cytochrome c oxidase assembly protein [Golovinomyces cichoracearum]|uniref:Putative cytochrome c oxidase assembly protein n=1 Tax=Golovinomyces cichoracearum TaxID=62708 RepID=A0A420HJ24_9PEZI|nr:putative cytochrome c oxidase assembly protein [Golovinomyces cichoracearum]